MESRETRGSVSRQVNLIEIQLEYIHREEQVYLKEIWA